MPLDGAGRVGTNGSFTVNAKLDPEEIEEVDPVNSEGPPPGPARVNLQRVHFTKELLDTVPREIAEQYTVLPVYVRKGKIKKRTPPEPGVLYIVAPSLEETGAAEDCSLCSNMKVRLFLADRDEILQAIPVVYAGGQYEPAPQPASSHAAPPRPPPPTRPQVTRSHSFPELPLIRPAGKAPDPPSAPTPTPPTPQDPSLALADAPATPHVPTPPTPQQIPPPGVLAQAMPSLQPAPPAPPAAPAPTLMPPAGAEPAPRPQTQRSSVEDEGPPRLVIVGALPGWLEFCRTAVLSIGGQVEACEMGRTQVLNSGPRPHLLVVPEEIYPFDRRAFNLLGLQLGVPLVVWSLDMDPADLQLLLTAAKASRAAPPSSRPAISSAAS